MNEGISHGLECPVLSSECGKIEPKSRLDAPNGD
jgi:hypothetical protein